MAKTKAKSVNIETGTDNGVQTTPPKDVVPEVLENLKAQYQNYVAEAEKFKTMANKALGAIEVLSSLTENKEQ